MHGLGNGIIGNPLLIGVDGLGEGNIGNCLGIGVFPVCDALLVFGPGVPFFMFAFFCVVEDLVTDDVAWLLTSGEVVCIMEAGFW